MHPKVCVTVFAAAAAALLLPASLAAAATQGRSDPALELEVLEERCEAWQRWFAATRSGLAGPELEAFLGERDPARRFAWPLVALAERSRGSDVAARALVLVLRLEGGSSVPLGGDEARPADLALGRLLGEHLGSPELAGLADALSPGAVRQLGTEPCLRLLRRAHYGSPHAAVRAAAGCALGLALAEFAGDDPLKRAEARWILAETAGSRELAAAPGSRPFVERAQRALGGLDAEVAADATPLPAPEGVPSAEEGASSGGAALPPGRS